MMDAWAGVAVGRFGDAHGGVAVEQLNHMTGRAISDACLIRGAL